MPSNKSSSENSVSEAQDAAIATIVFSRIRIPTSLKMTSVLIIVCLVLVFGISSDFAAIISHPMIFLIPIAGFLLWIMAIELVSGFKELLKPDKEYSSLLQESTEYEALVGETVSEIQPSWRSQSIIVPAIFSLLTYGLLAYSWVIGVVMLEDALVLGIVWFFWLVFVTSLQSCYRLNRILIGHVKEFFTNYEFSLHRFQDRFLSLSTKEEQTSIDSSKKRKLMAVKTTSSHYNLRNNATKLIRKTRGVATTFIVFGIELLLFLVLLNIGTGTGSVLNIGLNFTFVFVMIQLIFTTLLLLSNYTDAELAIHSVLDRSKRNLMELCDLLIVKTIIERRGSLGELKDDLEVSQNLFSYFSELPTWTVDSRLALSIGSGIAIQIVAIVITILNYFSS